MLYVWIIFHFESIIDPDDTSQEGLWKFDYFSCSAELVTQNIGMLTKILHGLFAEPEEHQTTLP